MKELVVNANPAISQISQIDNTLAKLDESRKDSPKAPQIYPNAPDKTVKMIIKIDNSQQRNISIEWIRVFT